MKLKILLVCILFTSQAYSQCPKYHQAMKAGKVFLEKKAFEKALIEFQAAQIAARECQIIKNEPTILLQAAFDSIQSQRDIAIEAEKKALESTQVAIIEKQKAELARLQADSAYMKAQELKELAIKQGKEALLLNEELAQTVNRNTALVGGVYFYADNYGLAFNDENQRFYYFDTLGTAHFQGKNLSFYEAGNFNNSGYARVKENQTTPYYSYFDTLGVFYPIVEKVGQINETTVFIELSEQNLKRIPRRIWQKGMVKLPSNQKTSRISTLQLSNNNIGKISKKVGYLTDLEVLNLNDNRIMWLPKTMTQLKKLKSLKLNNETSYLYFRNGINRLPNKIGDLKVLSQLNLNYHHLSKLPPSFSQLHNLEELNLRKNNFRHFPSEILSLEKLKKLDLSGNKIKKLPANLSTMKSLEVLNLTGNSIDKKEITSLKELLPNLQIIETDSTLKKRDHLLSLGMTGRFDYIFSKTTIGSSGEIWLTTNFSLNYMIKQYGIHFIYSIGIYDYWTGFELKGSRAFRNVPIQAYLGVGRGIYYNWLDFEENYLTRRIAIKDQPIWYFTSSIDYFFKKGRRNKTIKSHAIQFSFDISPQITTESEVEIIDKGYRKIDEYKENITFSFSRFSIGYAYYFGKTLNYKKRKF